MKKNLILTLIALSSICSAQRRIIDTLTFSGYDTTYNYYSFRHSNVYNRTIATNNITSLYNLSNLDTLNQYYSDVDSLTYTYGFQQYHAGVIVNGARVFVHCDNSNTMKLMNGALPNNFLTDASPAISYSDAINYAIGYCGATTYMWQDTTYQNALQRITANDSTGALDTTATYYPTAQLMYYPIDSTLTKYTLAYNVKVFSSVPYDKQSFLIDAKTGALIKTEELLASCGLPFNNISLSHQSIEQSYEVSCNENLSLLLQPPVQNCAGPCHLGNGNTFFYGIQTIYMWEKAAGFFGTSCKNRLEDGCDGPDIHTVQANGSDFIHTGNYYGPTNPNGSGSGNPGGNAAGVTAHWGVERANEYYRNIWGRSGWNGANVAVPVIIGESTYNGSNWTGNGLFDGSNLHFFAGNSLTVGNNPPVCLDVVCHEYTHGVTYYTSGLGQSGESGSLNEGFSDIMGNMAEFYIKNLWGFTTFSYVQGNESYLPGTTVISGVTFSPRRDMSWPKNTIQPDTYGGTNWISPSSSFDQGGKHVNASILDYWFYLLAEGGSNTNDNGDAYCVQALGKAKASDIIYKAFTTGFLTTGSNATFLDARAATIAYATHIYGATSNEVAQVTVAWFAVGVGPTFGGGDILIANRSVIAYNSAAYHFNNEVTLKNFTASSFNNVTVTSNVQVDLLGESSIIPDAYSLEYAAYITPSCAGGARMADNNNNGKNPIGNNSTVLDNGGSLQPAQNATSAKKTASTKVYPNPSNGMISIERNSDEPVNITLSNLSGQIVYTSNVTGALNNLDISVVQNGVYLLQVGCEKFKVVLMGQ